MPLGFSFQPGADQGQMQDQAVGGTKPNASTPQEAVQIRSLRVPRVLPANAPIARGLLAGPGGAINGSGAPGASGLTSLVQALLQAFQPQMATPQMPTGQTLPTFGSSAPQPTGPQFQGTIDTPPQQAPPFTFDQPTQNAILGGGGNQLPGRGGLNVYDRPGPNYAAPAFQWGENNTDPSAAIFNNMA